MRCSERWHRIAVAIGTSRCRRRGAWVVRPMNDEYILPGEIAALVAFWFTPPLLVALAGQVWFFAARGLFQDHMWRAFVAILLTALLSVVVGMLALLVSPKILPRWIGVTDVFIAGHYLPMLPLAAIAVFVVAPGVALWAVRRVSS
jgi:hypothetical protein